MRVATSSFRFFMAELQRRRVFSVGAGYLVLAGAVIEVLYQAGARLPEGTVFAAVVVAIAGLPPTIVLGWMYDITPHGLRRAPPVKMGELSEAQPRLPPLVYFGMVLLALLAVLYTAGLHYLPRVLGEELDATTEAQTRGASTAAPTRAGTRF